METPKMKWKIVLMCEHMNRAHTKRMVAQQTNRNAQIRKTLLIESDTWEGDRVLLTEENAIILSHPKYVGFYSRNIDQVTAHGIQCNVQYGPKE